MALKKVVENYVEERIKEFDSLDTGDFFIEDGYLYVKTDGLEALNLNEGRYEDFDSSYKVHQVEVSAIIS
ncbi:MAG: hypothetical protein UHU19_17820 [Lachnospiraceae bacterium]|nr:hypothetical protein [Lachnospiraceae bacterium]